MRLLSYLHNGKESYGAALGENVVNLSRAFPQYPTLADYLGAGRWQQAAQDAQGQPVDGTVASVDYLPVIPRPEKIVCAVRNYMDHHQEVLAAGMQRELSEERTSNRLDSRNRH